MGQHERSVDTVTVVGLMTDNCDIATAVSAGEPLPTSDLGTSTTQDRAAFAG